MRLLLLILTSVRLMAFDAEWTNRLPHASYVPPVGIQLPTFGITNSHWMFHPDINPSATYDYGSGAVAYRTNEYGPYSYYIDNTHGSATDTLNTYGTTDTPRLTFPWPVAAGSVVMIANAGTYTFNNGESSTLRFGGHGSSASPIFYVGVGATTNNLPGFSGKTILPHGEWMLISSLRLTNDSNISSRNDLYGGPITNVAFRNILAIGNGTSGSLSVIANSSGSEANYVRDFVVFTNVLKRYGNYTNATENDACASIFRDYSTNCWFIANDTTQFGGDTIRIGANQDNDSDNCLTDLHFIGHNNMHQNGENAIDVKKARRAVISENRIHDFQGYVPSGGDSSISLHYNPNYIWFINNEIYDGILGVSTGSRMQSTNEMWWIGNRIYDNSEGGMYWRGSFTNFVLQNTFAASGIGVRVSTSGGPVVMRMTNNIIHNVTTNIVDFQNSTTRGQTQIGSDNYYDASGFNIEWGTDYGSASAFDTAESAVANLTELDPLFTNEGSGDFTLQSGSPLKDAGAATISFAETRFLAQFGYALAYVDPNGNSVEDSPYVGAFEYTDGEEPPPEEPGTTTTSISGSVTITGGVTIQ